MVHYDVLNLRADEKVSRSRYVSCKFVVAIASSRGEEGGRGRCKTGVFQQAECFCETEERGEGVNGRRRSLFRVHT